MGDGHKGFYSGLIGMVCLCTVTRLDSGEISTIQNKQSWHWTRRETFFIGRGIWICTISQQWNGFFGLYKQSLKNTCNIQSTRRSRCTTDDYARLDGTHEASPYYIVIMSPECSISCFCRSRAHSTQVPQIEEFRSDA